jgi:hypothetical protein
MSAICFTHRPLTVKTKGSSFRILISQTYNTANFLCMDGLGVSGAIFSFDFKIYNPFPIVIFIRIFVLTGKRFLVLLRITRLS